MKVRKKLLLIIACVATITPAATLSMPQPQRGEPGTAPHTLRAGTMVGAHSLGELTSLAQHTASQAIGSASRDAGRVSRRGELTDSSEKPVPRAAGRDARVVPGMAQPGSGRQPDGGHAPAVPEPAGWVLLLSGLAVVVGIARRRAGLALM